MSVLTQDWPEIKSKRLERSIRLGMAPSAAGHGVAEITTGAKKVAVTGYFVTPIASDFGAAFLVEKFATQGGESYHVNLDGPRSSCECKSFLRWGRCKHISGLQALRDQGKM